MLDDRCSTTGKVRHPSPQHAHRAVSHQERRERGRHASSSDAAYKCPDCRSWHVRTPTSARRDAGRLLAHRTPRRGVRR